jgi:hypothetical protein
MVTAVKVRRCHRSGFRLDVGIINPAMNIVGLIGGTGMCRRQLKAGASSRNTSKFAHLRRCFVGDNQMVRTIYLIARLIVFSPPMQLIEGVRHLRQADIRHHGRGEHVLTRQPRRLVFIMGQGKAQGMVQLVDGPGVARIA